MAFQVGYSSASQFSREYSRMFGRSPLRDAMKIKETRNITERRVMLEHGRADRRDPIRAGLSYNRGVAAPSLLAVLEGLAYQQPSIIICAWHRLLVSP